MTVYLAYAKSLSDCCCNFDSTREIFVVVVKCYAAEIILIIAILIFGDEIRVPNCQLFISNDVW